jgi:hypothetical protein
VQVWTYNNKPNGWKKHGQIISVTFENGDQFGARAMLNGDLEVYRNGVLIGVRDISNWTYYANSGYIGLFTINASNTVFDNFGGGSFGTSPTPTPTPVPCTDPTSCDPVSAIPVYWRCDTPECSGGDWIGTVISWPSWSAYENNSRTGNNSRTVYSLDGEILYPYMGPWADGCQITAVSGIVLIIEWERGTDVWRETYLEPGQNHTISLASPENGALIEGLNDLWNDFSVSINNCTPQIISPDP